MNDLGLTLCLALVLALLLLFCLRCRWRGSFCVSSRWGRSSISILEL